MSEVTQILEAVARGDAGAARQLLPLVYQELRRLAARKLAGEAPGQTLDATALVHEAYLRLVGVGQEQPWDTRGHFFAAAAEARRRILIARARRKQRLKRGGRRRVEFQQAELAAPAVAPLDDLLAVDEALSRLAEEDPVKAELVKLR